ncbi:hypothetical protein Tdes44962_MAKER08867 [Teratosphaeria destructans]|uniref:Uncharacterized protein n=1 Tax=Teratosphaeria destructans TaxID=418781 RepID=A0A9W7W3W2_9PEZI|nr:hypothetical protein Tdes44962_MAKER08867 [Teratosphaeria destructans]
MLLHHDSSARRHPERPPARPTTYVVQIQSDAKILRQQQQRSWYLGEMDSLKKLLARILRKGRKGLRDSEQRPASPKDDKPRISDRAPQIPPTQPLSAVQSQETLGRNQYVRAGTSANAGVGGSEHILNQALKQDKEYAVSAMSEDIPPAPPPKLNDGAGEAIQAGPMEAAAAASAGITESEPHHITTTGEPESTRVTTSLDKENRPPQPNGTVAKDALSMWSAQTSEPSSTDPAVVSKAAPAKTSGPPPAAPPVTKTPAIFVEDKIPVHTEEHDLPPIKKMVAAPGMSATSGPLEDFPEGSFE